MSTVTCCPYCKHQEYSRVWGVTLDTACHALLGKVVSCGQCCELVRAAATLAEIGAR